MLCFKNFFVVLFAAALVAFLASPNCQAETVGISVNESIFSFNLKPGDSQNISVSVKGLSDEKQRLSIEASDYEIGEQNDITFTAEDNSGHGLKNWLKADNNQWFLESNEEKQITLSIDVPQNASPGSHYGAILLRSFPEISADNFQKPVISGRIAIHILIKVAGEAKGDGKISYFWAPFLAGKKLEVISEFENTGNVHYIPHGEIIVKNIITAKASNSELEKHFAFPGKKFRYSSNLDLPGLFGLYEVSASFVDGDGNTLYESKYIAGKLFLPAFITIVIVTIIFVRFLLKRKKDESLEI
jgi:uncharacterized protein involved in high-affinity Fe2+ transport